MAEHGYDDLVRDLAALGRAVDVPAPGPARWRPPSWSGWPTRPRRGPRRGRPRRRAGRRSRSPRCCSRCWRRRRCAPPSRTGSASAACGWSGASSGAGDRPDRRPTVSPGRVGCRRPRRWSTSRCSVPEALGEPDGVEVSADRRMVSMSWTTDEAGVLRLDQFDAAARLLASSSTAPDVVVRRGERHRRALVRGAARGRAARARRHPGHPLGPARRAHPDLAGRRHDAPARGRRRASAGPSRSRSPRSGRLTGTGRLTAV